MTKKEARNLLNNSRPKGNNAYLIMLNEALDMAIQTLDQKPCEDAISRQAAIDAMIKLEQDDIDQYGCKIPEGFDCSPAIKALEKLPSVTSQSKIGHWIDADGDNARCSCCNSLNFLYGTYCKHCGAKIENEVEEFDNLDTMLEDLWNATESEVEE